MALWEDLRRRFVLALETAREDDPPPTSTQEAEFLLKLVREWIERNSQLMILVGRYDDPALGGKE
jgi:hypothetical protein